MRKFALTTLTVTFGVLLGMWLFCTTMPSSAQSDDPVWTPPLNVSASGAASEPVVAVVPDGTMYVLWWDTAAGEQYARVSLTQTERSAPVTLPDIVGERVIGQDPQTMQQVVTLRPPREIRALTDATGRVHILWTNARGQLLSVQITGTRVTPAVIVSESVLHFDVATDPLGGVRVAYLRPKDEQRSPAGVYYRAWTGRGWLTPVLIMNSRYFITAKSDKVSISVAGNGEGSEVVAWDDPQLGRSLYARSSDGGGTWTGPQAVGYATSSSVAEARVAYAPNTEFVLIWRDLNAGSCVLIQIRSNDGMQTWSAPERVLNGLTGCPERWTFTNGADGRMWLLGTPPVTAASSSTSGGTVTSGRVALAAWNGQKWSTPVALGLSFYNTTISQTVNLDCINVALSSQTVGVVGCDLRGDVWVARNDVSLDELIPALTPIWDRVDVLSQVDQGAGTGAPLGAVGEVPALASDAQGQLYAMWSQSILSDQPRTALYVGAWNGQTWSSAVQVLESPKPIQVNTTSEFVSRAEQPTLVVDAAGKLHAVWVGGSGGMLYYSWALVRDAISAQGWSQPVDLPSPTRVCSWPSIVADPHGESFYVIYAVPYNEQRGIYIIRSDDGGATWSAPSQVFDAVAAGWLSADKPQLVFDATSNVLHAVWLRASLPGGATTQAVFYARSADGGQTWTVPALLAEGLVDWPRIGLLATNQVVTVWNAQLSPDSTQAAAPMTAWERFSPDGGERWADPAHVPGFDRVSGPVGITSEQNGVLYLTGVGQRTTGESILLYARRQAQGWGQQDTFDLGQDAVLGNAAASSLAPGAQRLDVVMRNWVIGRSGVGQFMAVAAMREISATLIEVAPAPTFTPLPVPTITATPASAPTPTPKPELSAQSVSQPSGTGSLQGEGVLLVSGVLATVILAAAIIFRSLYLARH